MKFSHSRIVSDRPSPPEGPLVASDVHKTGCNLAWNPPEDDGGAEVSSYLVEKMDEASGKWTPVRLVERAWMERFNNILMDHRSVPQVAVL